MHLIRRMLMGIAMMLFGGVHFLHPPEMALLGDFSLLAQAIVELACEAFLFLGLFFVVAGYLEGSRQ